MTTRRRHFCSLLGTALLLAAAPAAAQEAAERAAGPDAPSPTTPAAPARKPRQARKRPRPRAPAEGPKQAAPSLDMEHRLEAAPVPNRNLEAPRVPETDRTRLAPSVIHRPLPGQGMAAEGAASIQEERLFFPAPGARLNVPFSY